MSDCIKDCINLKLTEPETYTVAVALIDKLDYLNDIGKIDFEKNIKHLTNVIEQLSLLLDVDIIELLSISGN